MTGSAGEAQEFDAKAEFWLSLAAKQQDLGMKLNQLAHTQRELLALWDSSGDAELTEHARRIEQTLLDLTTDIVRLQQVAVDKVAVNIVKAGEALHDQ